MYHWHNYSQNQKVLRSSTKPFLQRYLTPKPTTSDLLQETLPVVNNTGWPWGLGHDKNKTSIAQETRKKQTAVFGILFPYPSFPKAETQEEQPWWNPSAALRAEMRWLWPFCQHSFILTTRQHLCHSVWAASQHYGNFKAQCHQLNVRYSSLPRQDLLQHQTRDMKRMKQKTGGQTAVKKHERSLESEFLRRGKLHKEWKYFKGFFFFTNQQLCLNIVVFYSNANTTPPA